MQMTEPIERKTMTIDEVATVLGVNRKSAYDAAHRGEIPVVKIGARLLVPREAFEKMLASGTYPPVDATPPQAA